MLKFPLKWKSSTSQILEKLIKYDFMFFYCTKFDYVGFKVIQGHYQGKISRSCWIKRLLKLNMSISQLLVGLSRVLFFLGVANSIILV